MRGAVRVCVYMCVKWDWGFGGGRVWVAKDKYCADYCLGQFVFCLVAVPRIVVALFLPSSPPHTTQ